MKILSIVTTLFISNLLCGQTICDDLNKAMSLYEEDKLQEAIAGHIKIYEKKVDTSTCYRHAFNNIPYLYLTSKTDEDQAKGIIWLNKILTSNLDDKERTENIMEPYANYKHRAALTLYKVYLAKKDYQAALKYLNQAEEKFDYQTFSASSFEVNANRMAYKRAQFYLAQNNNKKAIYILLNKVLDTNIFYRKRDAASFTSKDYYIALREETVKLINDEYPTKKTFVDNLKSCIKNLDFIKEEIIDENQYGKGTFKVDDHLFTIGFINIESKEKLVNLILENPIFKEIETN